MEEYEILNHMNKANAENIHFFLLHHAVMKESRETTKLRVVFDGSCNLNNGFSINETQCTGPTIQNDIFTIIARFRTHNYVLTDDIEKMYRCVWVHPQDRKYQGILWRKKSINEISSYQLNTITYGTTAAPFLAIQCLFQLAEENTIEYPTEADIIKNNFYVDDMMTGSESIEELKMTKMTHS